MKKQTNNSTETEQLVRNEKHRNELNKIKIMRLRQIKIDGHKIVDRTLTVTCFFSIKEHPVSCLRDNKIRHGHFAADKVRICCGRGTCTLKPANDDFNEDDIVEW